MIDRSVLGKAETMSVHNKSYYLGACKEVNKSLATRNVERR